MSYFIYPDARLFRDYLKAIERFSDEPIFHMDAEEMMTRSLNVDRVMAIELHLKKQVFDEYLCSSLLDFRINLKDLLTEKRAPLRQAPDKYMKIRMDLNLPGPNAKAKREYCTKLLGQLTKEWTFQHLDIDESESLPSPLKFNFDVEIELIAKALKDIIADADPSMPLTVTAFPDYAVSFDQKTEERKYHVGLKHGDPDLLRVKTLQECSSKYSVAYLEEILKSLEPLTEIVCLRFSKNMPVEVTPHLPDPDSHLRMWCAPRIEE